MASPAHVGGPLILDSPPETVLAAPPRPLRTPSPYQPAGRFPACEGRPSLGLCSGPGRYRGKLPLWARPACRRRMHKTVPCRHEIERIKDELAADTGGPKADRSDPEAPAPRPGSKPVDAAQAITPPRPRPCPRPAAHSPAPDDGPSSAAGSKIRPLSPAWFVRPRASRAHESNLPETDSKPTSRHPANVWDRP